MNKKQEYKRKYYAGCILIFSGLSLMIGILFIQFPANVLWLFAMLILIYLSATEVVKRSKNE